VICEFVYELLDDYNLRGGEVMVVFRDNDEV
jgi:hypothetical protein